MGAVLATLGGNGAVLVTAEGAWHATPPPTTVVSTVGAGDSSLFGYLLGDIRGLPAPERLALAVAYGSAAAGLPGTTIPLPSQLRTELVGVTRPRRHSMTDLITTDLVRLGAALGLGQARRDPRPRGRRRRRRPRQRQGPADRGRVRPRVDLGHRPARRASRSRTAARPGSRCRRSAFARLDPPVDFGAKDGPADLAFLIAAPAGGDADHLTILTKLARALVKPAFTDALRSAESVEEVVDLITHELGEPAPGAKPRGRPGRRVLRAAAAPAAAAPASTGKPSLVAVTACPTGIAHTYMAAEALEAAAERAGRRARTSRPRDRPAPRRSPPRRSRRPAP